MLYFYPADGHPDGPQTLPWFIQISDLIFPWNGHPTRSKGIPWYSQEGDRLHTVHGHPDWETPGHEHFHIRGGLCYPSGCHPDGVCDLPWYQITHTILKQN